MKILMLGWELHPHNAGGLGVACAHMCRALASQGADIDFIVPYINSHPDIDFMRVIPAIPADAREVMKHSGAYDSFYYQSKTGKKHEIAANDYHSIYEASVDRIVTLGEYDVIHAYDWLTIRPALRAKQLLGIPLIVNIHALEYDRSGGGYGNPFVRDIEYHGMMMADKVVAISQHVKNIIVREYHVPESKVEVIHNSHVISGLNNQIAGPNTYRYIEMMRSVGYGIVMFFGRLTIQKNLPGLLRVMQKVVEKHPKSMLVLMGSGEQELELVELAAELGIGGNVIFVGFQRGKEWRDMFGVSDICVMPSVSEPFGLTPLEAAEFGVPNLISRQSGVAEILSSALRSDYWDVDDMANQIVSVLQNKELATQLSEDGISEVSKINGDNNASKFLNLYRNQLGYAA